MPANERGGEGPGGSSGFMAFWSSLPGVLTGMAALITAIATISALDLGGGGGGGVVDGGRSSAGLPAGHEATATAGFGGAGCLRRYFDGIPVDRIRPVETGTTDFDVIAANQPKARTIGLKFTNHDALVGAMRIAFLPVNTLFKIESLVDERCTQIEEYANVARGGDANVLQNWDTVRFRLDGDAYDLRIGAGTTISVNFEAYAP